MIGKIIDIRGLSHVYGKLQAVKDVSFAVKEGEIFSLLGPNGAGKTTTINVLTTLLPLQKGKVTIAGVDLQDRPDDVRRNIGIVFQDETLDKDLTVRETMEFHGRIYSMDAKDRRRRIDELLRVVELDGRVDDLVGKLSGGMKRRLEIARGLMTRPRVLFLDEPTIGLDPQSRLRIWDEVRRVKKQGITIFLTTHYMDEADRLSDTINIIDEGKIIASGTPDSLKGSLGGDMIYLSTNDDGKARPFVKGLPDINKVRPSTQGLVLTTRKAGQMLLPGFMRAVEKAGFDILSVSLKKPTLDDVFIHYTGRELREDTGKKKADELTKMGGGM